ncbi:late histone H2B.2.1-like [Hemiscyllium ocellatum]|uniref:late histone H2B.2.1-like n=1 Tax=Hemiscyllium ocellatum TaxID=170820 RepID=UPI002966CF1E|nr:late histone H2B.2.1-like [Hemiscyllium ocellatum]
MAPKPAGARCYRKRKRRESYCRYIRRVLKQIHPERSLSAAAAAALDSFLGDLFERLASEASRLVRYSRRQTLSSREIQSAVRLLLPGELAQHAVSEGSKAVTTFAACP